MNLEWDSDTLGYIRTMSRQEMRSEVDHMTKKVLVEPRIPKMVKNEWTLRKGHASMHNWDQRVSEVSNFPGEQTQSPSATECLFVFIAETMRNAEGDPSSPGNTVYTQVTHPNTVSPFSFILDHWHYYSQTCNHNYLTNPNDVRI